MASRRRNAAMALEFLSSGTSRTVVVFSGQLWRQTQTPAHLNYSYAHSHDRVSNRLTLQQTVFGSCSSNWFHGLCHARRLWLLRSLCSGEPFKLMRKCW